MKILAALLTVVAMATVAEDERKLDNCHGLHAGITARVNPMYTENRTVSLGLLLVNDSESPRSVEAESWKLVIDGNELQDSGYISGNGPAPTGGYRSLKPGEHYQLGKDLPIPQYFSIGEHSVSWRGNGFQSSTITVKVAAASDLPK